MNVGIGSETRFPLESTRVVIPEKKKEMCFQHLNNLIQRETFTLWSFLFTAKSDPQIVARRKKNFAYAFKWPLARYLKIPPKER